MADLTLGFAKDIVKTAMAIKEVLDTDRQNNEECEELQVLVANVNNIMSQLEEVKFMIHPTTIYDMQETINRSLGQALKIINDFRKRNGVRRFMTAGDMAKKLHRVNDHIARKVQVWNLAINASILITISTKTTVVQHDGAHPLPTHPQDAMELEMYSTHSNTGLTEFSLSKTVTTHQVSENSNGGSSYTIVSKKIVIKMDMVGNNSKSKALSAIASLQGVKSMDIDVDYQKLTVFGHVDPVRIVRKLKKAILSAVIISVSEEKMPDPPKKPGPPKAPSLATSDMELPMKFAAAVGGVESVTPCGGDRRDQILVEGEGVDSVKLISRLQSNVAPEQLMQVSSVEDEKEQQEPATRRPRARSSGIRAITAKICSFISQRPRKTTSRVSRSAPLPPLLIEEHTDTPAWASMIVSAASLPQAFTHHDQEHARTSPLLTMAEDLSATPKLLQLPAPASPRQLAVVEDTFVAQDQLLLQHRAAVAAAPARRRRRTFNMSRVRRRARLPAARRQLSRMMQRARAEASPSTWCGSALRLLPPCASSALLLLGTVWAYASFAHP